VTADNDYRRLVDACRADDRVLGLVLTGSRGRGPFVRPESDWDVRVVVRDEAVEECAALATPHGSAVEVVVLSVSGLDQVGAVGSDSEWDRYSYVHASVVLDKLDGRVAALVREKGSLSADDAERVGAEALDTYVNSYYRSAKNLRDGLRVEAHLDAAESLSPFLTALFALHGRVRPFNRFLGWELERFPLDDERWRPEALLPRLDAIAASSDLATQQALFRDAELLARDRGLRAVIDGWEPDVARLRGPSA
jgi:predicted nucleotidyltransferase